jgi:uncharacterized protein DUF5110
MKKKLLLLGLRCAFTFTDLLAAPPAYIRTKDGIIFFTDLGLQVLPGPLNGANASFNLYEDEGTNYNYEKRAFPILPILYNEATKKVVVGQVKQSNWTMTHMTRR